MGCCEVNRKVRSVACDVLVLESIERVADRSTNRIATIGGAIDD
jgi:hypothetical protein